MANNCNPAEWALLPARLVAGLLATADGCWEWQGTRRDGYGIVSFLGGQCRVHRVAWFVLRGEVPDELVLDHLCRNRACCNPDHLEPVTRRLNTLRGDAVSALHAVKTHCDYGHPFDEANTRIEARRYGPVRVCRACELRRGAKWRDEHREGRKSTRRKVMTRGE